MAVLVLRLFLPKDDNRRAYLHQTIFEQLKSKGLLRPGFQYVKPELEEAMRERNDLFLSPYRAVEANLDELVGRGVLQKGRSYSLSNMARLRLALPESVVRSR
jgi:hypothetical protein